MRHEENSSGQLVSSNLNDCKMSNNSVTSWMEEVPNTHYY
jgi:hypothetical protein